MHDEPLANARHERFAQCLAQGMTADAAYREAGYKPNRGNATRLKSNERIQARVAHLKRQAAREAVITQADVLQRLLREADVGADAPDAVASAARVAALKLLGQHLGMFTEKHQHDVGDKFAALMREARPLPIGKAPPPRPD